MNKLMNMLAGFTGGLPIQEVIKSVFTRKTAPTQVPRQDPKTPESQARILAAQAKRERREAKRKSVTSRNANRR